DLFTLEKQVQEATDSHINKIDQMVASKEADVMQV
ncbi:MAG: ribosome-recycling factor, partial [Magnetococcales bacterium]|nr:ribosome-recycling factor [Magnetococcales bacterium]